MYDRTAYSGRRWKFLEMPAVKGEQNLPPPPLVGIGFTDLGEFWDHVQLFKSKVEWNAILSPYEFIKNIPKIQPSTTIVGSPLAQVRISKLNPFKGLGFVRAANYIHQAAAAALGPQMKLPLLKNVDEYLLFRGSSLHRSSGTPFII